MGSNGNPLISDLLSGGFTWPNARINEGGPLPLSMPGELSRPDASINDHTKLAEGGLRDSIYAYGPNPRRITTQTQNNIPNKVQRIIPKLFLPSAQSDGGSYQEPILEHALNDGDVVFVLRIPLEMDNSRYVLYPHGYSNGATKLINLATLNYILWGLQVGSFMPGNSMWLSYLSNLCKSDHEPLRQHLEDPANSYDPIQLDRLTTQEMIWNFIRTYFGPFGVQHGSDMQGGQHEGSKTRVVTNAVDYVSAFAVEGKLLKVNNLWKTCDVDEDDDVVLALRFMPPQPTPLVFNLSSSNRSHRMERAAVPRGWWYLQPETLAFKSIIETPYVHIGRSQKMVTAYAKKNFGNDMPSWNARAAIQGTPLQMTFEPSYRSSDLLRLKYRHNFRANFNFNAKPNFNFNFEEPFNEQEELQTLPEPPAKPAAHAFIPSTKRSSLVSFADAMQPLDESAPPPPTTKKAKTKAVSVAVLP